MNTLLEKVRRFPGGVDALAKKTSVPRSSIYAFVNGTHKRAPWRIIDALCKPLRMSKQQLFEAWHEEFHR